MTDLLLSAISDSINQVNSLYHRLVLLVRPSHDLWPHLRRLADATGYPLLNVSLELSRRLLPLKPSHRAALAAELLDELVAEAPAADALLLGALELLFEPSLRQDPLRLLQTLSRRRPIVASWNGSAADGYLFYAEPDHPEYRRYPTTDLVLIDPNRLH